MRLFKGRRDKPAGKSRKTNSNRRDRRGKQISVLYLLPSVIGVLLFFVLPFFIVIYYSVIDDPINAEFVFFDNFVMVFHNAAFQQAAKKYHDIFGCGSAPCGGIVSFACHDVRE